MLSRVVQLKRYHGSPHRPASRNWRIPATIARRRSRPPQKRAEPQATTHQPKASQTKHQTQEGGGSMSNAPFALDRREFIALAGGLAAVLVIGDGAYFASRRSAAHAQPVPSESGTLAQPKTPLSGTSSASNAKTPSAADPATEAESATPADAETPPTALEDLPWNLRLVNREHPLDADFEPNNLAELPDASWVEPHVNHRVDARIVEDLAAMLTAAEAAGTHPIICSSFRTYDYQENLFETRIERAEREEHLEGRSRRRHRGR